MATCTIFKNFTTPVENKSLIIILNDITSDKYKSNVEAIRSLKVEGKTEEAQEKKKQLPAFTPSATFKDRRVMDSFDNYSNFIHLDFDKLTPEQMQQAFEIITQIPYTFGCFISPSGNGLKVFVEVDTDLEHHDNAYAQVKHFYEENLGLPADEKCKDITRLCFVSYDPNLYKNIANEKFRVQLPPKVAVPAPVVSPTPVLPPAAQALPQPDDLQMEFLFKQQVEFTNRKIQYIDGNRNNFIYALASNCNRVGIRLVDALRLMQQDYDLASNEIETTVRSAYTHHKAEHSTVKLISTNADDAEDAPEPPMPNLPDDIFNTLPDFLKEIVKVATTKEERDILLLGSIVTMSVAVHKIYGKYRDTIVNANLFILLTGKASAGKGILIHCRKLIDPIHEALRDLAKNMKRQYEIDLADYNKNKANDPTVEKPQKPPQKMLFIPANNSATGFQEILGDSDSRGIIFETEGDTLANAFKTDYGDFSSAFRNAFQHEPISYYRRTDKEYVEIKRPCLSAMLSGTPQQIQTLIPNPENGLFSRFMFYRMNMNHGWDDVFATKTEDGLDKHFEALGNQFYELYKTLLAQPAICFTLTESQQQRFNDFFRKHQSVYITIHEDDYIGTVRRLGLTAFRMMMIFSFLRMLETGDLSGPLICNEEDFENTLQIVYILLKHSSYVYTQIAQEGVKAKPKKDNERFLDALPHTFNRQQYLAIAEALAMKDKTVQGYLRKFVVAGAILNPSHDHYINPAAKPNPDS